MFLLFKNVCRVLLTDKSIIKFAIGVLLGFAFSIAVILSTIGIMDGFDSTLKKGLRHSVGDLYIYSKDGFFSPSSELLFNLDDLGVENYTTYVQTEGFAILDENSKGVVIKGIDPKTYNEVTKMNLSLEGNDVGLGKELAKNLGVKIGDRIVLAMAKGNKSFSGLPLLREYFVRQIVHHEIYQKDSRSVYIYKDALQKVLNLDDRVNMLSIEIPKYFSERYNEDIEKSVEDFRKKIINTIDYSFSVRPFWSEYANLINAVKDQKLMIGLIFQLVVIISIFNVLAFVIFLNERKVREIFMFKALGMSQKKIYYAWMGMISLLWVGSCVISMAMVEIFNVGLQKLAIFQLPRDVYSLGSISIDLDFMDYILVFSSAYFWLIVVSWVGLRKIKKESILSGLRKEFA